MATELGDRIAPMEGAALGRGWSDDEIEEALRTARIRYERPPDIAEAAAQVIADDGVVAWFQGRSEFGPRALGHRSLLAHPGQADNVERLNDIKGREQFRPVAPMVLLDRAGEIFSRGPLPSPYMLFVHDVAPAWRDRLRAVTHVDHTARVQTVDADEDPLTGPAAGGVRRADRDPGGGQHQPEHGRSAHGRQSARRPRAVRLGPGRRPRHRPVPGPAAMTGNGASAVTYAVVIPTIGRAGLAELIHSADREPHPVCIVVADDRPSRPRHRRRCTCRSLAPR